VASPAAGLRAVDPSPFALALSESPPPAAPSASLDELLDGARSEIRPFSARSAPRAVRGSAGLVGGFRWSREDGRDRDWYPQGVSGSADADPSGLWGGRELIVVSWYQRATNRARVTFVDLGAGRYRHVGLVDHRLEPIHSHAGGIVWWDRWLYVAQTGAGLRVFDLHRLRSDGDWVLPQVGLYRRRGPVPRFSFLSADRSTHSLLSGEYRNGSSGAPLVRWPMCADGRLEVSDGAVHATAAWETGETNLQGAVALPDRVLLARSRGRILRGRLHVSPYAERSDSHRWAVGPEDLAQLPGGGRVLSITEHPDTVFPPRGRRAVFTAQAP